NTRKAGKGVKDVIKPALFIVESPTKAKHIARFFGNPGVKLIDNIIVYEVPAERHILMITACLGHVTDLTVNRGFHGVDIINGEFIPVYTSIKRCRSCGYQTTASMNVCIRCGSEDIDDSKNRIESLRKIASETGFVIIGTDPDAEGEKIAWDLSNMFSGISTIKRAEFHEITYHAIKKALSELRDIDESLVKAQIIRRVEDRWIGFVLSSKLQQVFRRKNISAGRVQTPVLKWIIERSERFRKKKRIAYSPELGLAFEDVNQRELNVNVVIEEEREENKTPLPPYTTDEMLRDANNLLKISSGLAMSLAQDLFENGLITYHRTDSIYVSETGKKIAQDYLGKDFQGRTWAVSKHGAHECIRPTRPYEKETIQRMIYEGILHVENLTQQHLVLYDMIFRRFMASQCKDYRVKIKRYRIEYDESSMIDERIVQASGKAFELYRGVLVKKEIPTGKLKIRLRHVLVPEEYPYTQADVIKQMKDKMIGRPSTYSTIIEKLFLRKYVFEIKRRLFPTPLGRKVCDYLFSRYEKFVSEERTRKLQEKMDEIERGKADYRDVMKEIYEEVTSDVF
ncbi:MAG: reverse gyrase, partial [Candidatus Aenigmatarchaeota archaeon]